jgi:hypothetical protein
MRTAFIFICDQTHIVIADLRLSVRPDSGQKLWRLPQNDL